MTTDEIIKLAHEADPFGECGRLYQVAELTPETLARFATLIRNEALEEAAGVCEELDEEASCKEGRLASGHECAAAIRAMKENGND